MSKDARIRYTRMTIKESFIHLNAEKELTQITVKELCERAGINRSTFYRNFTDIYSVMEWIEDEFVAKAVKLIHGAEVESTERTILSILSAIKEHQHRYLSLHDIPSTRLLSRIIKQTFADNKELLKARAPHLSEAELQRYYEYTSAGCTAIMIDWVKSGMTESPEEIARYIYKLVSADSAAINIR